MSFIVTLFFRFMSLPHGLKNQHHTCPLRISAALCVIGHVSLGWIAQLCDGYRFFAQRPLLIYPPANIY
jgi:hypothetical protein